MQFIIQIKLRHWEWKFSEENNVLTYNFLARLLPSQPFSILIVKLHWCRDPPWKTTVLLQSSPFQSPIQVSSTSIKRKVFIKKNWMSLFSKWLWFLTASTWHDFRETSDVVLSISASSKLKLPSRIELFQDNYFNSKFVRPEKLRDIVEDCHFFKKKIFKAPFA